MIVCRAVKDQHVWINCFAVKDGKTVGPVLSRGQVLKCAGTDKGGVNPALESRAALLDRLDFSVRRVVGAQQQEPRFFAVVLNQQNAGCQMGLTCVSCCQRCRTAAFFEGYVKPERLFVPHERFDMFDDETDVAV